MRKPQLGPTELHRPGNHDGCSIPEATLTVRHLEALELDGLDVVDKRGHLLGGVHLAAGRTLRTPISG